MDAGRRDQTILIETLSTTTNALGEEVPNWTYHSRPAAFVMETAGKEFLSGDYRAEEKAVFNIRWRAIDSTARVTWNERVYRIDSTTGTRRDGEMWLHCVSSEGAN